MQCVALRASVAGLTQEETGLKAALHKAEAASSEAGKEIARLRKVLKENRFVLQCIDVDREESTAHEAAAAPAASTQQGAVKGG